MEYEKLEMYSNEGWVSPLEITPNWCDLACRQLEQLADELVVFLHYRSRLYKLLVRAIAEGRVKDPQLCCEIIIEVENIKLQCSDL